MKKQTQYVSLFDAAQGREKVIGSKLIKKPKKPALVVHGKVKGSKSRKFGGSPLASNRPKETLYRQKGVGMKYISVYDMGNLAKVLNGDIEKINPAILVSAGRAARRLLGYAAVKAKKFGRYLTPGYHARRARRYKKAVKAHSGVRRGLNRKGLKMAPGPSEVAAKKRLRTARRARNIRYGVGGLAVMGASRGLVDRKKKRQVPTGYGY